MVPYQGDITTHTHTHSHHDRAHHCQLVVEMTCLINVARLKGDLEAGAAHAKPHTVHVDMVRPRIPRCTAVVIGKLLNKGRGSLGIPIHCKRAQ